MLAFMFSTENGVFAELSTLFVLAIAAIAVPLRWALPCFVGVWVIWLFSLSSMRGLSDFVSLFLMVIAVAGPLVVMIRGTRPAHQPF